MGLAGTRKKPPLPAPTESLSGLDPVSDSPDEDDGLRIAPSDLETILTTHTDKTSYEVPEDGSPVTINTTKQTRDRNATGKLVKGKTSRTKTTANSSQTSLLIEYFEEGGGEEGRRPSVRVRVTPSKKGKDGAGAGQGSVRITERNSTKPSYSRSISLGAGEAGISQVVESNISSLDSGSNLSEDRPPVDIQVRNMGAESDLSRLADEESRFVPINPSEISSMPPDSMLAGESAPSPVKLNRRRSRSLEREADITNYDTLKPKPQRTRSLSREREVARQAVEKMAERDRRQKEKEREHRRVSSGSGKHKSRSSKEYLSNEKPRRKSSKSYDKEESVSSANPSLLTGSNVSGLSAKSMDSTASSIKNPKLLQTVEDAIRRLILPEINALKNEQKNNRRLSRYDDESSPSSSVRSEEIRSTRKTSGPKLKLNGDTIKSSKGSRRSGGREVLDSPDREFERGLSEETIVRDDSKSRRRSKDKTRDALFTATAAGLTAAALKTKDSASSIERRERRKRRSKDQGRSHSRTSSRAESRTDSQADSLDGFSKHKVAPMPMASGLGLTDSDMTRDSILSERTSTPTNDRTKEVRDLVRDSPNELSPGGSETPTRLLSPVLERFHDFSEEDEEQRHDVFDSMHLKKREPTQRNLADEYPHDEDDYDDDPYAADAYPQQKPYVPQTYTDPNYSSPGYAFQRRGLSPIQSVASFEERGEEPPQQHIYQNQTQSSTSLSSVDRDLHQQSMETVSSGTAEMIQRKEMRPKPLNFETARETLHGHKSPVNNVIGGRLGQNVRTIGSNPELVTTPHGVESAVASLLEPSTVGGQSNLSYGSNEPGSQRYSNEIDQRRESLLSQDRNLHTPERSSPLKREINPNDLDERMMSPYHHEHAHSLTPSRERPESNQSSPFVEQPGNMHHSAIRAGASPMPAYGYGQEDEDEIETNPSPIQGPGGADVLEGAMYGSKGQQSKTSSAQESLRARAKEMLEAAAGIGAGAALMQSSKEGKLDSWTRETYPSPPQSQNRMKAGGSPARDREMPKDEPGSFTPWQPDYTPLQPFEKDEGYQSGLPPAAPLSDRSTPDYRGANSKAMPPGLFGMDFGGNVENDPFTSPGKPRPMTGRSDAMSPLYDSATGHGLDRIQNKDIVALMDHLTVRDSQRNARDTEILMTLVRSAAEMRNSFEDMKRFVDNKNGAVVNETRQQGVETRRAIGGPRAMPSKGLSSRASEEMTDDIPDKRRNVFRRALKGLGGGSKQDLGKIENMLMQLLDEVADIKAAQTTSPPQTSEYTTGPIRSGTGLTSYEQLRDAPMAPVNYQASGRASGEHRNDSGYSSANSSYKPGAGPSTGYLRRGSEHLRTSQNRVSTVAEAENEDDDADEIALDDHDTKILGDERADIMLTPTREFRGGEFAGPPVTSGGPRNGQASVEATPSRKNRASTGSGFVQKISRWSKTTASSIPGIDATPRTSGGNGPARRPVSELSRSASDLAAEDAYDVRDHYDPTGDDRIRSKTSLSARSAFSASTSATNNNKQYRPPSPLIPSHVSEKPTYSAHRDSQDLQHPQPRQGPTARYQNHLETEATNFGWGETDHNVSPTSDVLGNNPVLSRFGGREAGNRYSGGGVSAGGDLSPINERSGAPSLPPKVKDEGPLIPPKVPLNEDFGKNASFGGRMTTANASNSMPARKPTGPRPITRSGSYSPAGGMSGLDEYKANRHRQSPNHIPSDDESETF